MPRMGQILLVWKSKSNHGQRCWPICANALKSHFVWILDYCRLGCKVFGKYNGNATLCQFSTKLIVNPKKLTQHMKYNRLGSQSTTLTQMENDHWTHLLHAKLLDLESRYLHNVYHVNDRMSNVGHFIRRVLTGTNWITFIISGKPQSEVKTHKE